MKSAGEITTARVYRKTLKALNPTIRHLRKMNARRDYGTADAIQWLVNQVAATQQWEPDLHAISAECMKLRQTVYYLQSKIKRLENKAVTDTSYKTVYG